MNSVDYLILGIDIGGLAFADTILNDSEASVAFVVDSGAKHDQLNSYAQLLSSGRALGTIGINSYTLRDWFDEFQHPYGRYSTAAALQPYVEFVLENRLRPLSRIHLFNDMEYLGDGRLRSQTDGKVVELNIRRKVVDATRLPAPPCPSFIPYFAVSPGIRIVQPQALNAVELLRTAAFDAFCVLGGGQSGTEMVLTLLTLGVSNDRIRWVKARDPWMIAAPAPGKNHNPIRQLHESLKAMAHAYSEHDLATRLERLGVLLRTSADQTPSYFSPHLITPEDAERVKRIPHTIRKGHVHAISEIGMILSRGAVPMPSQTLYIDCTGHRARSNQLSPVFDDASISLTEIQLCHPSFSAAMIGAIELLGSSTAEKNQFCTPIGGGGLADMLLNSILNHHAWFHHDGLRRWLETCRLDRLLQVSARKLNHHSQIPTDFSAIRATLPRAIINLESLAQQDRSIGPLRA